MFTTLVWLTERQISEKSECPSNVFRKKYYFSQKIFTKKGIIRFYPSYFAKIRFELDTLLTADEFVLFILMSRDLKAMDDIFNYWLVESFDTNSLFEPTNQDLIKKIIVNLFYYFHTDHYNIKAHINILLFK